MLDPHYIHSWLFISFCQTIDPIMDNLSIAEPSVCMVCGKPQSGEAQILPIPGQVNPETSYPYRWYACCSYFRQEPAIPLKELYALYDANYFVFSSWTQGLKRWIHELIIKKRRQRLKSFIVDKEILEIGCGKGEFLHASKVFKPLSLMGIEISADAANEARNRYGLNIISAPVESFQPDKTFDTVFMFHVIEHLTEPLKILHHCSSMLKEGGTIVLETPNAISLERDFYGINWVQFSAPFHTFVFSSITIEIMLKKAGFVNIKTHHHPLTYTFSSLISFTFQNGLSFKKIFKSFKFLLAVPFVSHMKKSGTITVIATKPA